jgi:tetratricopeptide (TPR) repeat protein
MDLTFSKKLNKIALIIMLLTILTTISCTPQTIKNKGLSNISPKQSFDSLLRYSETHIYQIPSDSLLFYADSIFRSIYNVDTIGSNCLDLMIRLSEQSLKKDQSSIDAAQHLFSLYMSKKQYYRAIEIGNKYFADTSDVVHLLTKSIIYLKIGEREMANQGFDIVKRNCERILQNNPNLKKDSYLGNMWMISLILYIKDGKEKSLLNFKLAKDKYPDDLFVSGLYEKIEGYTNVNDLIENNLP